jgi:hypothetical protein
MAFLKVIENDQMIIDLSAAAQVTVVRFGHG